MGLWVTSLITSKMVSEVVAEARDAGYTEPDPRDDLSGIDVARKVQRISATFYCNVYKVLSAFLSSCGWYLMSFDRDA